MNVILKEILKTKLSIAISNNDISLPLIHHRSGTYARIAGETIMIFQCKEVTVTIRKTSECVLELPIRYKSKNSFIALNTRIITHKATPIFCHDILKP